jgi:predicted metal-dependent hydrolase
MKLAIFTLILSTLAAACVACGTGDIFEPTPPYNTPTTGNKTYETEIDEELELFVALFMADCEAKRKDCKYRLNKIKEIKVVDMPDLDKSDNEMVIGLCYDSLFTKRVHVNREIIHYADRYLQALVYHELGHCMYGLDHVEESDKLMSPAMPSFTALMRDWGKLVEEMFNAIEEYHGP